MENASKALLIAASVLIVILLIAFGMKIFNSTSGTGEQVEGVMQTTEITMFNNKFMQYVGQDKSLNDVKALANVIIAHNATNTSNRVGFSISDPKIIGSSQVPSTISSYIPKLSGNTYIIQPNINNSTGRIIGINVRYVN